MTASQQLAALLAKCPPELVKTAKAARARLRQRLPGAIVSIAIYPRWVNLFFLQGAHLPDPEGVLQGSGNQVRFIRLDPGATILDSPAVRGLIAEAIAFGDVPFRGGKGRLVIRTISRNPRRRR